MFEVFDSVNGFFDDSFESRLAVVRFVEGSGDIRIVFTDFVEEVDRARLLDFGLDGAFLLLAETTHFVKIFREGGLRVGKFINDCWKVVLEDFCVVGEEVLDKFIFAESGKDCVNGVPWSGLVPDI
jgi:hypothetical protein